uniref:Uncharacterized protein n=1 Tax=Sphaerodactylus townsendi TaxID=933632 RepID=A0ACB8EAH3_9SAUR
MLRATSRKSQARTPFLTTVRYVVRDRKRGVEQIHGERVVFFKRLTHRFKAACQGRALTRATRVASRITPPSDAFFQGDDAIFCPYASCYGNKQAVQLLGRNSYFSLFANPPCLISHRQRLACPAPEMTLRQISHLIRVLRQLNLRDAKGNQLPNPQR